jgi:hypothetical protein
VFGGFFNKLDRGWLPLFLLLAAKFEEAHVRRCVFSEPIGNWWGFGFLHGL